MALIKSFILRLKIIPKETRNYTKKQHLFTVIDLDKSKSYPQNFVCILPKTIQKNKKPANTFERLFQSESKKVATELLKKALRSRPDHKTAISIRERLKTLQPKSTNKIKCKKCGQSYKQKKRKNKKYQFCFVCYQKQLKK